MLKKILAFALIPLIMIGCSEKDEPNNPVISFLTVDKYIKVTNNGTHAILTSPGTGGEYEIALGGDFSNYKLETTDNSRILSYTKIENRVLSFTVWQNWDEEMKSANITITANNASEIVTAELVVNSLPLTDAETQQIAIDDINWMVSNQTVKDVPSNPMNIEKHVLYRLNNEGTAYMRLINCKDVRIPIKQGDKVDISYAGTTLWQSEYENDWYLNPLVRDSEPFVFTFTGLNHDILSHFGEGILLPLTHGICYGDDFDVILTPHLVTPDAKQYRQAFIYAVQYNDPDKASSSKLKARSRK